MPSFTDGRKFLWIKRTISPEQRQRVHDLGEPGLLFGPREARLYPNGAVAAHVLGGASFGREGVHAAEVIGTAGVERVFDARLRDPAGSTQPLRLSIDLKVQTALEDVLAQGMTEMSAKGAVGILMEADTGQIRALASLPDFDPNLRPPLPTSGDPADSPLFNRAAQGRYELGSVFKPFTVASAIEAGLVGPQTLVELKSPMRYGRFTIRDFHDYGAAADGRGRAGEVVEHRRRAYRHDARRGAAAGVLRADRAARRLAGRADPRRRGPRRCCRRAGPSSRPSPSPTATAWR